MHGEFCSDDFITITTNPAVRHLTDWQGLWISFNTRFLVGLSFAANYHFGGLQVFGYHVVNAALHVLVSFLVFCISRLLAGLPEGNAWLRQKNPHLIAAFAALIFLTHPLQTQTGAYITQRATSMAALFYLSSVWFYLRARCEDKKHFYYASLISMTLGMFCKEFMVTLPFVLFAAEFFWGESLSGQRSYKKTLPFFILALAVPAALAVDQGNSAIALKEQITRHLFSGEYFLTELNAVRTYWRMMFWPAGLSHNYTYPLSKGLADITTLISIVFIGGLLGIAKFLFHRVRVAGWGIVWFFLATAVEILHPCFAQQGILYDHWIYLGMAGVCLMISAVIFTVVRSVKIATVILLIVTLFFSALSIQRNRVWQTCERVWIDVMEKYPQDHMPYVNLGVLYSRKGNPGKAVMLYEKALTVPGLDNPILAHIYTNLAAAYGRMGDYHREISSCQKALALDPNNILAYSNMGLAYTLLGDYNQAVIYAEKAVEIGPGNPVAHNNLGYLYVQMGEWDKARSSFERALALMPDDSQVRNNFLMLQHL